MIFYNKKEFAKAGISTTAPPLGSYSQFLATASAWCRRAPRSTPSIRRRRASSSSPGTTSTRCTRPRAAASNWSQNGKATFDSAAGRAVAAFWQQMYAQNLAGKEIYNGDSFADGTAAMAIVGPWAIASLQGQGQLGRGAGTDRTRQHGPTQAPTFSDAKNIAMYASCKNRATAWDFLKFSTSADQDGKLLTMTGQMPMRQGVQQQYASYFTANP